MLTKPFLLKLFSAANMRRWNDKICPVELRELDKQAHKMVITYFLGKLEEDAGNRIDWNKIIEGGLFEFLQRLVVTDLKPQIYHRIRQDQKKYAALNSWVYANLQETIAPLGPDFCDRFKKYFAGAPGGAGLERPIISAAHFYATTWEFGILERSNPEGYEIRDIKTGFLKEQARYAGLKSFQRLNQAKKYRDFLDLVGELRFQVRWSHLNMDPRVSVLGHMLVVAIVAYLFSRQIEASPSRCYNNFFTGLFHDLPEVLTRDIINPVKTSFTGMSRLVKDYEKQEMARKIYRPGLIPKAWQPEMKMFTEDEFSDLKDPLHLRDGTLVRAADRLAAYVESYLMIKNGSANEELHRARANLKKEYQNKKVAGLDIGRIIRGFN